jgi:hypothetical protein
VVTGATWNDILSRRIVVTGATWNDIFSRRIVVTGATWNDMGSGGATSGGARRGCLLIFELLLYSITLSVIHGVVPQQLYAAPIP